MRQKLNSKFRKERRKKNKEIGRADKNFITKTNERKDREREQKKKKRHTQ